MDILSSEVSCLAISPSFSRIASASSVAGGASRRPAAFTLVELVVLLAVVALAAAVAVPAMRHAAVTPNTLVCQGALRVIGMAHMMYSDDNNDTLCPVKVVYTTPPPGEYAATWHWFNFELLGRYAGGKHAPANSPDYYDYPAVFKGCPDFRFNTGMAWIPGYGVVAEIYESVNGNITLTGYNLYGYESGLWGTPYRFYRRSEFACPAYRGLQGDSNQWHLSGDPAPMIYVPPGANPYPGWAAGTEPGTLMAADPTRHGAGANYLFIDGHVAALAAQVSGHAFANYTLLLPPGDFNGDAAVNQGDYTVWADSYGKHGNALFADANHDGVVDQSDYTVWADNFR